jgi:hypothetical protein
VTAPPTATAECASPSIPRVPHRRRRHGPGRACLALALQPVCSGTPARAGPHCPALPRTAPHCPALPRTAPHCPTGAPARCAAEGRRGPGSQGELGDLLLDGESAGEGGAEGGGSSGGGRRRGGAAGPDEDFAVRLRANARREAAGLSARLGQDRAAQEVQARAQPTGPSQCCAQTTAVPCAARRRALGVDARNWRRACWSSSTQCCSTSARSLPHPPLHPRKAGGTAPGLRAANSPRGAAASQRGARPDARACCRGIRTLLESSGLRARGACGWRRGG